MSISASAAHCGRSASELGKGRGCGVLSRGDAVGQAHAAVARAGEVPARPVREGGVDGGEAALAADRVLGHEVVPARDPAQDRRLGGPEGLRHVLLDGGVHLVVRSGDQRTRPLGQEGADQDRPVGGAARPLARGDGASGGRAAGGAAGVRVEEAVPDRRLGERFGAVPH